LWVGGLSTMILLGELLRFAPVYDWEDRALQSATQTHNRL